MNNDVLVIMMFQCRYISGNKHTIMRKELRMEGVLHKWEQELYVKPYSILLQT